MSWLSVTSVAVFWCKAATYSQLSEMQKLFKDLPQNDTVRKKVNMPDAAVMAAHTVCSGLVCDWLRVLIQTDTLFCPGGPSESAGV